MIRKTLLVSTLVAASACGGGLSLGSLTGSSDEPASGTGSALAPSVAGGSEADRVADLSRKMTYQNAENGLEAFRIFDQIGVSMSFNARKHMDNPDPEWIPGWDALELSDESRTAICQAAVNRTWTEKVHKDYARYRKEWKAIGADVTPKLAAIMKQPGYYRRAADLAALWKDTTARAEKAKVLYPAGYGPAYVGPTAEIAAAMVALHAEAKLPFFLDGYLEAQKIRLADLQAAARPFADDAVERDLFTAAAQKVGTLETPPLPVLAEYGKGLQVVRWPTSDQRDAETGKARVALVARLGGTLALERAAIPSLFDRGTTAKTEPALYWIEPNTTGTDHFTPLLVTRVKRKGDGAELELETTYEYSVPKKCRMTNRVESVDINGGVHYAQECQYDFFKKPHRLEVAVAELPPGLELAKGDEVFLYADLVEARDRAKAAEYELTDRAIVRVKRGDKVVHQYP